MMNKKATIMVVDDVPANLKLLESMLQAQNYRVVAFPKGALALKAAHKNPPDLILLDINMPEMDGYEVCERLKEDERLKDIPVLFISALSETLDKVKAFNAGGVDYVTKPFQFEEVHARVETHLELYLKKHELQDAYDKLKELETMRDNLVHMIVHDMRTPLQGISGFLELAQLSPLPEKVNGYINVSLDSANVLLDMVTSLLDVSKMESGQMTPDLSPNDIGVILMEIYQKFDLIKGQRTMLVSKPDEAVIVPCDSSLIQRVVQNLVSNAFKFTDKEDGAIELSIEPKEKTVRVSISDNGDGISEEHQKNIFDKFYQVEARKQGKAHSTGLGLTFCKLAVEAHGGNIGVNSKPHHGTTFWFELPV